MIEFLKTVRTIALIFLAGGATGAYAEFRYDTQPTLQIAERGYCRQKDPFGSGYWFACMDAAVALELQQRTIERDAQLADDTKAILADMKPKGKKR